jgi:hypothetical protein
MEKLEETLTTLLKDLSSLPEERMHQRLVKDRLGELSGEEAAYLLDLFYTRYPEATGSVYLHRLLIDPDTLLDMLGTVRHKEAYVASLEMDFPKISRMLTDLPPKKCGPHGYDKEEEAKMESMTLGERRTMSKGSVKDTLDRLLSDPDKMVVTNLLDNPRLTEVEVLKIASKRPSSPKILKQLATHRKWGKRQRVLKAIVSNPYSSPRIALSLLHFIVSKDIKEIAGNKALHPQVIIEAEEMLRARDKD